MGCKLTLRNLLRLDAGALEPAERDSLRAAIRQSANCQRVWRLMSKQSARLEAGQVGLGAAEQEPARLAAELIAAYLDGSLGSEQTQWLERRALQEPDLLAELMLHFRGQAEQAGTEPLPWAVTERLFAIGDGLSRERPADRKLPGGKGQGAEKVPLVPTSGVRPQQVPSPRPVQIQMARSVATAGRRASVPKKSTRKGILAAALTTGAASVGIWFGYGNWSEMGSDSRVAQQAVQAARTDQANAEAPSLARAAQRGTPLPSGNSSVTGSTQAGGGASGWAVVSLDEGPESETSDWQIDPAASVFHQFSGHIVDCKWLALEGVVALREPGQDVWFGPRSTAQTANGLEWRTLPGSWATARLGGLGEIVLDSDSAVVVNASAPENLLALDLAGGRVGLKKLPADLTLQIKHDRVTWEISVLEQGTSLGVDWLDGEPRLALQSGRVRIADRYLGRNEQLVWRSGLETPQVTSPTMTATNSLPEQLAWLDKPRDQAVVSGAAQAELLASGNVVAEMNRLGKISAAPEQVLAQHLPAILAPEVHLLAVLEGTDAKSRSEALEWLLRLPPRSPKTRQIWRSISQKSGVPELAPEYFRLVQLVRNSAPVVETDADFLTAGLKHERLFVREMSQILLELRFGNTVQYDATESDIRRRNQLAERWTREILAGYQPTAVPKR